ncbi:MAG: WbqC family protein, partial [Bacteroidetes bacterium]|nr:WbqC family protein [Bacteroidota bacterium]
MSDSKIIAIHQPNFFPWLGYFYKIANCDTFVILDNVEFQQGNHNSITNRTKIKCNGEEKFFTISVKKNKESKLIKDILIDKNATHIVKHLKTIQYNYAKAAHFKEVYPVIEKILLEFMNHPGMSEGNTFIIQSVCELLNIHTPIVKASDLDLQSEDRNERIIEIC